MIVDTYIFNGRNYYLFHTNNNNIPNAIVYKFYETYEYDSRNYLVHAVESLYRNNTICGLIHIEENFIKTFNNGIIRKVHLLPITTMYRTNYLRNSLDENYKLDYLFENELPHILLEKNMDVKFIKTYLSCLRQSLVLEDDDVNSWLQRYGVERDINHDPHKTIKEFILKMPKQVINTICYVINGNRLNSCISPNIFYYNEMNKIQQSALSIKKSCYDGNDNDDCEDVTMEDVEDKSENDTTNDDDDDDVGGGDVDEDETMEDNKNNNDKVRVILLEDLYKANFSPNALTYVFCSKYKLVLTQISDSELETLLQRFLVIAYMICDVHDNNKMLKTTKLVIDGEIFSEFCTTKIKKKPIQFTILDDNFDMKGANLVFEKHGTRMNVLHSGCPIYRQLVKYNTEQNAAKCKYIEIAARVCPHILAMLCEKYKITFIIRRTVQRSDQKFIFYEVFFYVHRMYIDEILTHLYPINYEEGCQHQKFVQNDYEETVDEIVTSFDACWMQVPCFHIYYHTYFSFYLKYIANLLSLSSDPSNTFCNIFKVNCMDPCVKAKLKEHPIFKVAIYNYTMFEYIKANGKISIMNKDSSAFFINIYISIVQIVDRDIISPLIRCEFDNVLNRKLQTPNDATNININTLQKNIMRQLNVKFVEFNGVEDGPMVHAISIRSCEQMRKNSSLKTKRTYGTNIVNYNMLINNAHHIGQESGHTKLSL